MYINTRQATMLIAHHKVTLHPLQSPEKKNKNKKKQKHTLKLKMAVGTTRQSIAHFMDIEPIKFSFSSPTAIARQSVHLPNHVRK